MTLVVAILVDLVAREAPSAIHPVVWMGKLIAWLERLSPGPDRMWPSLVAGVGMAVLVPAVAGGVAWLATSALRQFGPIAYVLVGSVLLSTTFAVRELGRAANRTRSAMESGDGEGARRSLRSLVSRDTRALAPPLVAMAAIESVAENTTDSFVGPWLAFALFGLPGAFAYRAINTLDSMIGYRGRYEYLGKAAARLDDLVNLIPARLSALLMLVAGRLLCGLPAARGRQVAVRDRRSTASPNAGWTIGAAAGLLGVVLEKPGHYRIGDGLRGPGHSDIGAAVRLGYAVSAAALPVMVGVLALRGWVWG
ncbi:MAG: adenosylcobinamide-phosphate synthase CbiB [bacterium]|nr:adenosylcobinamide-phosphate synthase CbiB [bacterium]MDE0352903.1 adenosylcobinamide-phosphate synthase CbiB [bacterium]